MKFKTLVKQAVAMMPAFLDSNKYDASISILRFESAFGDGLITAVDIYVHSIYKEREIVDKFTLRDYVEEGKNVEELERFKKFINEMEG